MDKEYLYQLISDHNAMRSLIGRPVRYADEACEICDVLFEESLLVLASLSCDEMQDDSYGRPHRKVPAYHSLPFKDDAGNPSYMWGELIFLDGEGAS
ncbi:MAG: hypothetical protein CO186_11205 [Zetaproteobacteria bacterium CG_4_9_14_3_um_filter_49_83]|nr:MAG: hypothetical protein AUJ56_03535 [Zetaproteobacteria bacterium CG1_02_49_23]PIQ34696.1 MAG: hypothetical protein COW62_00890 [Zetaproteobacteria bacterium CG17_big_fil_post_rev_8_21_14_2_50_50_13]PIV30004.1 MAG: hypothetical protein COS35_08970 [Zetaproteobacteria bacterium CG02_land_8_20_14_3_00_50_9]PIY54991.1 MAG: hypothetical protein COZ00_11800 [Zetaproteobacteria bacterium CG_4_10_14_0_8_um_filter_49_80]PJA34279.1 MAG: hypothetical protein CO186_11205 [Zetaproteobacteria bacterium